MKDDKRVQIAVGILVEFAAKAIDDGYQSERLLAAVLELVRAEQAGELWSEDVKKQKRVGFLA